MHFKPTAPSSAKIFLDPCKLQQINSLYVKEDGDCSHEIKRRLLLRRKAMANLDSVLKIRDITLPTSIHVAMVFPVILY